MIGKTIAQYKVLEKLGEGGMGVVYKALDTKLDRTVALKFLPHHLTANDAEKARFMQEAKATAQINHPNVCSVIDIQEFENEQFIVMEYVDGQTLRARLQGGGLPVQDGVTYAIQISEALQEAHAKGIVHRDIKCENIMINSRNQIKVMDFGLAKLKGSLKLTRTSSTVGTLAYMAPEQIQGGEVDHRSDIFSFGVVLFEMITGHTPFRGDHEASIIYSIVNEEPEQATRYRPELSPELLHIFNRALEKDPADRYQSMNDVLIDLRRLKRESAKVSRASLSSMPVPEAARRVPAEGSPAAGAISTSDSMSGAGHSAAQATPAAQTGSAPAAPLAGLPSQARGFSGKKIVISAALTVVVLGAAVVLYLRVPSSAPEVSVPGKRVMAVLPFENMGTPEQEYFADGITEEITSRLSGLSGLAVIARTSALQYKKTTKTLKEIGGELGVEYVLQGTIRWGTTTDNKPRVRVNPALIKVSDATQVWSQPYDAVLSDVFAMQSDIASQVANALGITLLQPERKTLEAIPTQNSAAYDAYLRGRDYFTRSYTKQDFQIAIQMFEKAVELDPQFALAYAKLGETNAAMYWFYYDHSQARLEAAKKAIDKSLALDPELADAHQSFGYYYYWGFLDYENALKELTIAQKSRPNDSRLLLGIGSVQRRQGKFELAAASMAKGFELDPRSSDIAYNASQTYGLLRRFDEANRYIDQALTLAPDIAQRISYKANLHWLTDGDTKASGALLEQAAVTADINDKVSVQWFMAINEKYSGNYAGALAIFSGGLVRPLDDQFNYISPALEIAELHGLMGKKELAREYYDSARVGLEELIRNQPDDARYHSALGVAYAGLGRKADAVREGARAVELLPISKEAWRGARRLRDMARINAMVGNTAEAIANLQTLLSVPAEVTPTFLRIDPVWAPLRSLPEFQKLLTEHK